MNRVGPRYMPAIAHIFFLAVLLLFTFPAALAFSAGTPDSSQLFINAGQDTTLGNGDYVQSDQNPFGPLAGLNSPQRFYIEVPDNITRLIVEIFDGDVDGTHDDPFDQDEDTFMTYNLYSPGKACELSSIENAVMVVEDGECVSNSGPDSVEDCANNAWRTLADLTISSLNPAHHGHWCLLIDSSEGTDSNGFGIRAHDGDTTSGGDELSVYAESFVPLGVFTDQPGDTRTYDLFPYVVNGCELTEYDFDMDSSNNTNNSGGTIVLTAPTNQPAFTSTRTGTALSAQTVWAGALHSGWTSSSRAFNYGIWDLDFTVDIPDTNGGNIAVYYILDEANAVASTTTPPTAQPQPGSFRIYLPSDGGGTPRKVTLTQFMSVISGPNPPEAGQTTTFEVTVSAINLTNPYNVAFAANTTNNPDRDVTLTVPTSDTQVAAPVITSFTGVTNTTIDGAGDTVIEWTPQIVFSDTSESLIFTVAVTPTSVPVDLDLVQGTTGIFWDESCADQASNNQANPNQPQCSLVARTRALMTIGPLCNLSTLNAISLAFISSFDAYASGSGAVVEWQTTSEVGTVGFNLLREAATGEYTQVNDGLLVGLLHHPEGGTYSYLDTGASAGGTYRYKIEELESGGQIRSYGPFEVTVGEARATKRGNSDGFSATPRAMSEYVVDRIFTRDVAVAERAIKQATAAVIRSHRRSRASAKAYIARDGIYEISAAELGTVMGVGTRRVRNWIGSRRLSIKNLGKSVAYERGPGNNSIIFYAQAIDSIFTDKNVYWIENARGVYMNSRRTRRASQSETSFIDTVHAEEDVFGLITLATGPEDDFFMWDFIVAPMTKDFNVLTPGVTDPAGEATVVATLRGELSTDHHVVIRVNGVDVPLDQPTWNGPVQHVVTGTFPQSALLDGAPGNTVEVEGDLGGSIFYVESIDIIYERNYEAYDGELIFTTAGRSNITVTGFGSPAAVKVYDITNPLRPRVVSTSVSGADSVSFITRSGGNFVASEGTGTPHYTEAASPVNLKSSRTRGEYVIVTTADMMDAAAVLADHRRGQGLSAMVVNIDHVYDNFSFGIVSPQALKDFVAWAYEEWREPVEYLVLGADGSYDFKGVFGTNDNLVPVNMVMTSYGLFSGDIQIGNVNGIGPPEVAVGRVPATNADELAAYIQKVIEYESSGTQTWAENVIMSSDVGFASSSNQLQSIVGGGYVAHQVSLDTLSLSDARAELFGLLDVGAVLLNFVGHGGLTSVGNLGALLDKADLGDLTDPTSGLVLNGGRLPVVSALTCVIGRSELPGFVTLAEALVLKREGGAVAVWSPSGLNPNSEAVELGTGFFESLFVQGEDVLGKAVLDALADFSNIGIDSDLLSIYQIMGDPALLLKLPEPPAALPAAAGEDEN